MKISRREFLGGVVIAGVAATVGTLAGCTPSSSAGTTNDDVSVQNTTNEKPSFFTAPEPVASDQIVETIETDVLVVGCGIAGCAAAAAAAEEGVRVVALEKAGTFQFRGGDIGVINSKQQIALGYETDPDEVVFELRRWGGFNNDERVIRAYVNQSGMVMDWAQELLAAHGVPTIPNPFKVHTLPKWISQIPTLGDGLAAPIDYYSPQGQFVGTLYKEAEDKGAEFHFNTTAEQLIQNDESQVTGVIAKGSDGYIQINASKGVILATGDYGADHEMLSYYIPSSKDMVQSSYPGDYNSGDGHKMGLWVGAAMDRAPHCPMYFDAALVEQTGSLEGIPLTRQPWLCVNGKGERFGNENLPFGYICNSTMTQAGNTYWPIWDSKWGDEAYLMKQYACKSMPGDAENTAAVLHDPEQVKKAIENGVIHSADTFEELAEGMGIPVDTFLATVERYNALCEKGIDEDFGKDPSLLFKLDSPPYYSANLGATLLVTMGGLKINAKMQVLNEHDDPIKGLYAVGNTSGNFFAYDYPITVEGCSHGRALTFGYLAGKAACGAEI